MSFRESNFSDTKHGGYGKEGGVCYRCLLAAQMGSTNDRVILWSLEKPFVLGVEKDPLV